MLGELTPEVFRQKLAGLVDPDALPDAASVRQDIRDAAIRALCVFAKLYGDGLDRLTMWGKIDAAVQAAGVKCNGDLHRWVSLCLESVKADPVFAAACDSLASVVELFSVRPTGWAKQFLGYVADHRFPLVTMSRARWAKVLKGEVDL